MKDLSNITIMEELFKSWKQEHIEEIDISYFGDNIPKETFLPDGIIDINLYNSAKKKILILGKERYQHYPKGCKEDNEKVEQIFWHKEVALGNVKETLFSKRLSLVANAIINDDYVTVNKSHDILKSISVLNLNKRGGYNYCVWNTLETYVRKYKEYIEKEIKLIDPSIIVCCGNDIKWLLEKKRFSVPEGKKVITISHPSYFRISDKDYLLQIKKEMEK